MEYVELHCHSAFSFLDGASSPDELVATALERGHHTMALTDHDTVSGSMEFAQAAAGLGLRAIHGAEVTVGGEGGAPDRHLTLLVRDATGWRNLCRLLTRAHAHTRVYGGSGVGARGLRGGAGAGGPATGDIGASLTPEAATGGPLSDRPRTRGSRVVEKPSLRLADVVARAEGLVCLTGCPAHGVRDEPTLRALMEGFGTERLRVELQRPFARHDRTLNRGLAALATRLGLHCVATGNVHAHSAARARLQDVFVAIREHTTLDASEPLRRGNHSHVLASPQAMAARFADHPNAVAETVRLAEMLTFDLTSDLGYRYPGAEDAGADTELARVCEHAFGERYPMGHRLRGEAAGRLEEELRVIAELGLSGFFLLHRDLLELAREVAAEVRGGAAARSLLPPGRGRGSSVSSIVCYLTGLSHVDPIANDLLLGRFLNEELTSLPDIDLDFPRDIRAVLIPRVHERYGKDRSALVAAFPTFKARGAIREIGKALGLPPGEIERVARGAEGWGVAAVDSDIDVALGEGRREGRWAWLAELSQEAYGLPRHLSQHSGGMIVATRPLVDCCPVVPAAMEGRQMVMWDKDSCSDAGFLKIDLLGLGMLSAVESSVELIAARRGERVDLSRIPFDDEATFRSIQEAQTTGVFQIESRAQMGSLRRTRPETLEDLTIQVAIVRPGPIVGGAVNPYIERKQRQREDPCFEVPYEHRSLEPVLRETLGTIIFQDQVIESARAFAGFSPGEAEGLRRAMSRKRSDAAIRAFHERFVQGAIDRWDVEVDEARAERVWSMVVGFSGFGFPKAHGAAFGLLAYQSAWLREHYGPEFLCSLLDEQPMGFYPPDALTHEAQRRGIVVLAPDVNASMVGCAVVDVPSALTERAQLESGAGPSRIAPRSSDRPAETFTSAVRLGLGYVLGVRADEVAALVATREADGPFRSLDDLAGRAGAGRPALEQLAWSGACDGLALASEEAPSSELRCSSPYPGAARRTALWRLGIAAPPQRAGKEGTQLVLALDLPAPPALKPLDRWAAMLADYATTTVSTGDHPLGLLRAELRGRGASSSRDLERLWHGTNVKIGGLVVARQRPGTAKGVTFLLLEDEAGTVNLVIPPPVYERDRLIVRTEPLVLATGRLERHAAAGGAINVVVDRLASLASPGREDAIVRDLGREEEAKQPAQENLGLGATGTDDFRAVAPAVMSFAQGRRR